MSDYQPPFHMTDKMILLIAEIREQDGRITVLQGETISPHLRHENLIRTIRPSLAIEHHLLSLEQVTSILNGKRDLIRTGNHIIAWAITPWYFRSIFSRMLIVDVLSPMQVKLHFFKAIVQSA